MGSGEEREERTCTLVTVKGVRQRARATGMAVSPDFIEEMVAQLEQRFDELLKVAIEKRAEELRIAKMVGARITNPPLKRRHLVSAEAEVPEKGRDSLAEWVKEVTAQRRDPEPVEVREERHRIAWQ